MPIRRTSNRSSYDSGFYNPEVYSEIGSRIVSFTPNLVSGLQIWLDASDSSTLFDAASGGSLVPPDGQVARWEDKSGNLRHATQTDSSRRPLRRVSSQNSLATLSFDGSNDFLSVPSSNTIFRFLHFSAYTVFAVFRSGTTSDPNRLSPIIATFTTFGGNPGMCLYHDDRVITTPPRNNVMAHTVNNLFTAVISYNTADDTFPSNTYGLLTATGDIASTTASERSTLYYNGNNIGSNSTTANSGTSANSQANLTIGAASAQFWFLGNIAEIVIYNSVLSVGNRTALESYFISKWGLL